MLFCFWSVNFGQKFYPREHTGRVCLWRREIESNQAYQLMYFSCIMLINDNISYDVQQDVTFIQPGAESFAIIRPLVEMHFNLGRSLTGCRLWSVPSIPTSTVSFWYAIQCVCFAIAAILHITWRLMNWSLCRPPWSRTNACVWAF